MTFLWNALQRFTGCWAMGFGREIVGVFKRKLKSSNYAGAIDDMMVKNSSKSDKYTLELFVYCDTTETEALI